MRDLARSWFWAAGTAVVFLTLAGRSLATSGTSGGPGLAVLVILLGVAPALAAGVAHPAPARGSLPRYLVAVVPWVALPALANAASAGSAGASAGVVVGAFALPFMGAGAGAVAGALAVQPHPERRRQWRPLRVAGRRRGSSYLPEGTNR